MVEYNLNHDERTILWASLVASCFPIPSLFILAYVFNIPYGLLIQAIIISYTFIGFVSLFLLFWELR